MTLALARALAVGSKQERNRTAEIYCIRGPTSARFQPDARVRFRLIERYIKEICMQAIFEVAAYWIFASE